jgi:hypothetical protein
LEIEPEEGTDEDALPNTIDREICRSYFVVENPVKGLTKRALLVLALAFSGPTRPKSIDQ